MNANAPAKPRSHRAHRYSVPLPDELADAIQGESMRRLVAPSVVIAEFFVECFPEWMKVRLQRDFARANSEQVALPEGMPYSPSDDDFGLAVQMGAS